MMLNGLKTSVHVHVIFKVVNSRRRNCKFYVFHYVTLGFHQKHVRQNKERKGKEKMHHRTLQNIRPLQNPSRKQCLRGQVTKKRPL